MGFIDIPVIGFFVGPNRQIDTLSGYITLSEVTTDSLEITQQPVQQGAMISDHAFSKPTNLTLQVQFNTSSATSGLLGGLVGTVTSAFSDVTGIGGGTSAQLQKVYKKLLDLQALRTPFTIATPKRVYKSMLFATLGLTTDKKTENVLAINAAFQQVIIVNVTSTSIDRALQSLPGVTGATEQAGSKSALVTLKQGLGL